MNFEIKIEGFDFTLESFIELLKKILDGIYDALWGNKEEE